MFLTDAIASVWPYRKLGVRCQQNTMIDDMKIFKVKLKRVERGTIKFMCQCYWKTIRITSMCGKMKFLYATVYMIKRRCKMRTTTRRMLILVLKHSQ